MPMGATWPSCLTHSCQFAYFNPSNYAHLFQDLFSLETSRLCSRNTLEMTLRCLQAVCCAQVLLNVDNTYSLIAHTVLKYGVISARACAFHLLLIMRIVYGGWRHHPQRRTLSSLLDFSSKPPSIWFGRRETLDCTLAHANRLRRSFKSWRRPCLWSWILCPGTWGSLVAPLLRIWELGLVFSKSCL